jgi:hypothetical protein
MIVGHHCQSEKSDAQDGYCELEANTFTNVRRRFLVLEERARITTPES